MAMLELVQQFDDVHPSNLANVPITECRKDVIAKAAADRKEWHMETSSGGGAPFKWKKQTPYP